MELARPLIDPVWVEAVATAVFLVAPFVARGTRLPSIVVLNPVGTAVGPAGAGLLARDPTFALPALLALAAAPALALGVHRVGLRHPQGRRRVHVVAVLVSPVDGPAQPHLARLANVVQRLHEVGVRPLRQAPEAAVVVRPLGRPARQPSTSA
ncbi:MAG: hypothetical protein P1P87_16335 [Trueperaceae bacterium]|nr:hypothetical protein [Trueperaceae bacterium]